LKNNIFLHQLGDYFNNFLPGIKRVSKNTISAYADSFAVFFQFLYEVKGMQHNVLTYNHFTAALFDEYLLWMKNERNYGISTICQRTTALRAFLKYASRREMRAISAYTNALGIECPHKKTTEFPYFTIDETRILLSLPNPDKYLGDRDLVLLSLLYETGARAQEICDLCVGDIRFGHPTKVKLNGKRSKLREVPISEAVANLVKYHINKHHHNYSESRETPLFSSQKNAQMTTSCIRSIVDKYVGIAKKENPSLFYEKNYSPHSFRHSKAVHMIENGSNLIYIRNFLGHASISSTEIYARVGQAAVTKALTERKIPRISGSVPTKTTDDPLRLPDCINKAR